METKFTKGDWETNNDYVWSGIKQICDIYEIDNANKDIEAMSNAKLISAAPDMFNALRELLVYCRQNSTSQLEPKIKNAANALNKAVGCSFF